MFYAILAAALVALDQLVKYLICENLYEYESIPLIPHVLNLTYVQNTGAAFSILSRHTWILILVSAVVVLVMCWLIFKGFFKNALGRWAAALVLAGGLGNLIDRVVFGAVTDMFQTVFIDFPVFNVADCCITIGVILLVLYILLYKGREEPAGGVEAEKPAGGAVIKELTAGADGEESADSEGRKNSPGLWIAVGAAGAAVLSLCVFGVVRVKKKKKEKKTQRGKRGKKRGMGR